MPYEKPLPTPTAADRRFWEAAKQHRLLLPRCRDCRHTWLPPYLSCPKCVSANIEWVEASGRGKVWGSIEMRQAYLSSFEKDLPYNVALIRLEEGPMLFSNVAGVRWEELRPDADVEVFFEDVTDEVTLPKFRLVNL